MKPTHYLDHNATTPLDPKVLDTMWSERKAQHLNPASPHRAGQQARARLESYRQDLVDMLGGISRGMATDRLVFTSGGTESNNLAVLGLAESARHQSTDPNNRRVLISSIEHPSISELAGELVRRGFEVERIPVDTDGRCQLAELEALLDRPALLVSMMLANNETGVIQPVTEMAALCRQRGVLSHTDAVQAVGKIPVRFRELGVDALSLTAHKLGGPRCIGGLLLREGVLPQPQLFGGHQQSSLRPGTEDLTLVAGLHRAVALFDEDPSGRHDHLKLLRDSLQRRLQEEIPELVVIGQAVPRTPHTLSVALPGVDRQSLLMSADMEGLYLSAGSACASGSSEPSPVLQAMGLPEAVVQSAVRISLGVEQSLVEIEDAADRLSAVFERLRPGSPGADPKPSTNASRDGK